MPAIIIGALLVIPIIIIIVIVVVIRIYKKGGPLILLVTSALSVSLCIYAKGHYIYSCIYIYSLYYHLLNKNIHQNLSITVHSSTPECFIYESLNLNFNIFTKGLYLFMYMDISVYTVSLLKNHYYSCVYTHYFLHISELIKK